MAKFLILRYSSIGDIILTTPVVRNLKQQVPNAEVHFATKKQNVGLLSHNPYIDKIHILEKSEGKHLAQLKLEKFDYIIDLHHNIRTLKIRWSLGAKAFSFDKLNWQKWLFVNFKINKLPPSHIVDRYMATLDSFAVKNDAKGLDFFIPKQDEYELEPLKSKSYVAYALGGQHFTKKLPIHKMVELCASIHEPIVLVGGPEDALNALYIKDALPTKEIYSICGITNVNQSASVIQKASKVYTHDTGMMHVAAAFHRPIISIWGNTVPAFGMYPYTADYQVIINKDLNCQPCSKIGHNKCPKGHFLCMEALTFDKT